MHRAKSCWRAIHRSESEWRQDRVELSLLHSNFDFPGFRLFCFRKLKSQHPVLELCGYFRLVDFLVQLELAKKIDQLVFTIQRFARSRMRRFRADCEQIVFHQQIEISFLDARQISFNDETSGCLIDIDRRRDVAFLTAGTFATGKVLILTIGRYGFFCHDVSSYEWLAFHASLTLICFGFAFSAFGRLTNSTPFLYSARMPCSSTSTGSSTVRTNFPLARSLRWNASGLTSGVMRIFSPDSVNRLCMMSTFRDSGSMPGVNAST